jgi:endonuclease YncB( thermonuclease family)
MPQRISRAAWTAGAGMLLLAMAACWGAAVAACNPGLIGEGRVASVTGETTFRLTDGREIRLAGLVPASALDPIGETATASAHRGTAALESLLRDRAVTLRGVGPKPDRYGRLSAFVYAGDERSLNARLLAEGLGVASGDDGGFAGCAIALLSSEAEARAAQKGVWADPAATKNTERPDDILPWIGRFVVAEGKIVSVREAGGTVYVNFGRRWTRDLAVTIPKRMIRSFGASGLVPKALEGRTVRVRGFVEQRGGPRIEALAPGQIEVLVGTPLSR